jgi:hypothetical protein
VAVWQQGQTDSDLHGMGTTITALALVAGPDGRDVVALANVGDSRAYVYSGARMVQITDDHSLAEEKVRQGEMTPAEAAVHPHRHILTRALGVGSDVNVDLWELQVRTGDRLVLCSDGLSNEVDPQEMAAILAATPDPQGAAEALVARANEHGGNDNITVVVVDVLVGGRGETATVIAPLLGDRRCCAARAGPNHRHAGDSRPSKRHTGASLGAHGRDHHHDARRRRHGRCTHRRRPCGPARRPGGADSHRDHRRDRATRGVSGPSDTPG